MLKESIVKEQHVLAKENECRVLLDTHLTEDLLQGRSNKRVNTYDSRNSQKMAVTS